jgi:hypothetical protein
MQCSDDVLPCGLQGSSRVSRVVQGTLASAQRDMERMLGCTSVRCSEVGDVAPSDSKVSRCGHSGICSVVDEPRICTLAPLSLALSTVVVVYHRNFSGQTARGGGTRGKISTTGSATYPLVGPGCRWPTDIQMLQGRKAEIVTASSMFNSSSGATFTDLGALVLYHHHPKVANRARSDQLAHPPSNCFCCCRGHAEWLIHWVPFPAISVIFLPGNAKQGETALTGRCSRVANFALITYIQSSCGSLNKSSIKDKGDAGDTQPPGFSAILFCLLHAFTILKVCQHFENRRSLGQHYLRDELVRSQMARLRPGRVACSLTLS